MTKSEEFILVGGNWIRVSEVAAVERYASSPFKSRVRTVQGLSYLSKQEPRVIVEKILGPTD